METKCVLEVQLASPKIRKGQDVDITVLLRNTGNQGLWVNQRLLLNINHSPRTMREIWVDVVGPDGAPVLFSSHVRAGEAGADNFAVLKPATAVSKPIKLSKYFPFDKPGAYRITVHYQDGTRDIPKAPGTTPHFREALSAGPVTLEVLAP